MEDVNSDKNKVADNMPTATEINEKYAYNLDEALNVAGGTAFILGSYCFHTAVSPGRSNLSANHTTTGVGCYNLKYGLVLSLFLIAAIVEPLGYSYILPAAKCDLEMTDAQRGVIASIPYIGIVIASFPLGYLVDTQGRKKVAIWSSVLSGVFAMLAGFMPNITTFIICKFLGAMFIAGPAAVPYSFIGEIIPPKDRDLILSIVNALQICGSGLVPLIAWGILRINFSVNFGMYDFRPWRLLNIVNGFIFIIAAFFMSFGPESPKYLMAQGKQEDALKVLQTIYAGNKGKSPEEFPIKALKMESTGTATKSNFCTSLKEQTVPLLKTPYLKWVILNSILLFGVFATLNGLYVWVPDILNRVLTGNDDGKSITVCSVIEAKLNETVETSICDDYISTSTFVINAIASSICALVAVAGSSTVKIIGKKALLIFTYSIIGIFAILVNFITQDILFAVFLSSFPVMGIGVGPVNAYAVEIFPTQFRGMAISLTMMVGRLGSVVGTNLAAALLNLSCPSTFYVFGGSLLLCALLVLLLPKTKNPSTLERACFS